MKSPEEYNGSDSSNEPIEVKIIAAASDGMVNITPAKVQAIRSLIAQDRAAKTGCCGKCDGIDIHDINKHYCLDKNCPCHAPTEDAGEWENELENYNKCNGMRCPHETAEDHYVVDKQFIRTIISKEREELIREVEILSRKEGFTSFEKMAGWNAALSAVIEIITKRK